MPKSTIFLAGLSLLLAIATGAVVWLVVWSPTTRPNPNIAGDLSIGLPGGGSEGGEVVRAQSALLWNSKAGVIESEYNGFERLPIASITKLMTAMVAVDMGINWEQEVEILPEEYVIGGRLLLHPGEKATMRDLWHASLMGSANNATLAMARTMPVDEDEFVLAMNRKAIELGLEQTEFVEVTGLDPDNVSTAYEVARLAEAAFRDYPEIAAATAKQEYSYVVGGSGREHVIRNTNKLITEQGMELVGGKTGYLWEASFCLVAASKDYTAVVLGSPSEWDSVQEIESLLQSGYGGI